MAQRKTSLYLDEELLREAKVRAAREGRSTTSLIEESLRRLLRGPSSGRRRRSFAPGGRLPTALYRGTGRPNDPDDIYL
jgi:hypothetical protein